MEKKKCIKCKKNKSLVNYYNNKFNKDGKSKKCKDCCKKYYKNTGISASFNDIPDVKKCSKCKENHLLVNYHNSKYGKGGKVSICKYCCKEKIKKYRGKRIPDANIPAIDLDEQILIDVENIDKNYSTDDIPEEEFNPLGESVKERGYIGSINQNTHNEKIIEEPKYNMKSNSTQIEVNSNLFNQNTNQNNTSNNDIPDIIGLNDTKDISAMKNKKERDLFVEQQTYIRQRILSLKNEYKTIEGISFFDSSFEKTQRDNERLLEIKSQMIILEELLICVKPDTKQHNK